MPLPQRVVVLAIAPPSIAITALIGAVPMALGAVAVVFHGVETRGRRLEEITVGTLAEGAEGRRASA